MLQVHTETVLCDLILGLRLRRPSALAKQLPGAIHIFCFLPTLDLRQVLFLTNYIQQTTG